VPSSANFNPAVVTDVDFPVWPNSCPVGTAPGLGYDLLDAIRAHAGQAAARGFYHQHAAVIHGDGPFGEPQSGGNLSHL
jgi:hypothetical protein